MRGAPSRSTLRELDLTPYEERMVTINCSTLPSDSDSDSDSDQENLSSSDITDTPQSSSTLASQTASKTSEENLSSSHVLTRSPSPSSITKQLPSCRKRKASQHKEKKMQSKPVFITIPESQLIFYSREQLNLLALSRTMVECSIQVEE